MNAINTLPVCGPDVKMTSGNLMAMAHIARNLRPPDHEEVLSAACRTPDGLAAGHFAVWNDLCRVVWFADIPTAVVGANEMWPGVWSMWAWGTGHWPYVVGSITRYIRRELDPALRLRGAHRAQAISLATHTDAHRWIEMLGMQREGVLRGYGRAGQDYVMFAWRRDERD